MEPQFQFPFEPYDIQKKFMKELYDTIDKQELGIFESPTGTGKSLSICCGALQWLKDNNKKVVEDLEKEITVLKEKNSDIPAADDWLQEEYHKVKNNQIIASLQLKLDKLNKREEYFNDLKKRVASCKSNINKIDHYFKKQTPEITEDKENKLEGDLDNDLMIEDVDVQDDDSEHEDVEDNESDPITKIYISSRTHSQLSQFVGEIKRTVFNNNIRVVTMGSRQHYCINSDVNKLKNVNLINERCLDLQKSKTKSTLTDEDGNVLKKTKTKTCTGCPFYNQSNITKLKERLLVDIMDMEDLVKCGKLLKACPYYASRMALDESEVVLISHAGILSSGARSGMSLKLKDNIVILDEAHGLTAALENAYSAPVSGKQLKCLKTFLQFYINKYRSRLSSKNLLLLNQMNFVVGRLFNILNTKDGETNEAKIYTLEDFVIKAEIDHMNLRPLVEFCRQTRLAPKLHGFSMRYSQQELEESEKVKQVDKKRSFKDFLSNISKKTEKEKVVEEKQVEKPTMQISENKTSAGSALYAVLDLIEMLCARSAAGRVLVQRDTCDAALRYLLLDTADRFVDIVQQCRSVIVAGGTMEPIGEFRALLDKGPGTRVRVLQCAHAAPPDRVLALCVARGPANCALNFSYEQRMGKELLDEVGRILRNVCSIVPGGVVCFLPSYSYEQVVYDHMKVTNVIDAISKKKTVFREPKSAADVDQVLQKYAAAINNRDTEKTGALLLSVVGGKLSEGLNFSDDLGRCVLVFGLPYPNVKSPELKEKMNYLNQAAPGAGAQYYENLCMKAVNQCIGRAVRHINDYATVLLVDERYSRPSTIAALPSFVQKSLIPNCSFGQTASSIARFFSKHKIKTQ
ncbi:ATP-dependent DNA helicase DDX11-like [Zerene cesonia]|uniref:ATP-dependent DNA helicase DDX11-like n=1 Tax=Zerene cesonia TaxID=33412 RepID=UPI0018E5633F|nr:ATP-dependent DNA helicase DDX11-like [Zerene cesonia]